MEQQRSRLLAPAPAKPPLAPSKGPMKRAAEVPRREKITSACKECKVRKSKVRRYMRPRNGRILISVSDSAMGESLVGHAIRTTPGVFMTRIMINAGVLS